MNETKITNHVEAIKSLLLTLKVSQRVHALIVESSAGWVKTTSILEAIIKTCTCIVVHVADRRSTHE